jgi:hypothetical protein
LIFQEINFVTEEYINLLSKIREKQKNQSQNEENKEQPQNENENDEDLEITIKKYTIIPFNKKLNLAIIIDIIKVIKIMAFEKV